MNNPITSCCHGFNWTLGNGLSEISSLVNKRLDYERDMRYWSGDHEDENYYVDEKEEMEYDYEPVEMPHDDPEEPGSPLTPKTRGSASKRKKVKLTKSGGANFDWD